jgi:hypothetical protein
MDNNDSDDDDDNNNNDNKIITITELIRTECFLDLCLPISLSEDL